MAKIGKSVATYTGSLATSTVISHNEGFVVNLDGTIFCTPRGNIAEDANDSDLQIQLPVKAGAIYPIDCAKFNVGGSTTLTQIWVVFGQEQ
jgi:hypothetical protein